LTWSNSGKHGYREASKRIYLGAPDNFGERVSSILPPRKRKKERLIYNILHQPERRRNGRRVIGKSSRRGGRRIREKN